MNAAPHESGSKVSPIAVSPRPGASPNILTAQAEFGRTSSPARKMAECGAGATVRRPARMAQASGVDRIRAGRLTVVPTRRGDLLAQVDYPRWADQLQQKGSRPSSWAISAYWMLNACAMLLTERNQPILVWASALPGLDAQVGDIEGRIDQAEPRLDRQRMLRVGHEV